VGDEVLHGPVVDHPLAPLRRGQALEQRVEAVHPGGVPDAGFLAGGRTAGNGRSQDGAAQPRRRWDGDRGRQASHRLP
jgi:hypothetical protein